LGDSVREANRGEDAGSEEGVAAEGVEQGVVWARDVRVDPLDIGELLNSEFADRSFVAFANPFQRQVIAGCIQREWGGQGPEATFGKAPKEGVRLKVEGGAFPVSLRPRL
jgi:hypothetical protein